MDDMLRVKTSDLINYLARYPIDTVDLVDVKVIFQCLASGDDKGMFPQYVSIYDYAKQHNVTKQRVYILIKEGRIKARRFIDGYYIRKDAPYPEDRRKKAVGTKEDQNEHI